MAGMLPGVECARRRRCHQSGGISDSVAAAALGMSRRSSFCLYTSNYHESHLSSGSSLQRSNQAYQDDDKLGGVAGEAKERLDERLRAQWKTGTKRNNISHESSLRSKLDGRTVVSRDLQIDVFGVKKNGLKRFNWGKLGWKATGQTECAICLDHFKTGEPVVNLPCAHRFHSRCLVPWLDTNAHCPCCRMGIS